MIKNIMCYQKIREMYYMIKDWEKTKDAIELAKKIRPLHNRHKGQACVVVGNGPSLRAEDLTRLYELGIPTFGCNRIHLIFPQTPWRPTYYFISDEKLLDQYKDEVDGVPSDHRFFPKKFRGKVQNGIFYNDIYFDYEHEGKFSVNAAKGIYPAGSVTTEMIQMAYYMGFYEIYLIGVDFNYATTVALNQKSYVYQGEKNYFVDGYLKKGEVADMPNINANLLGFQAARREIEAHRRVICNATRGGKLEVFQRVNLDELFVKWEELKK